MRKWGWVVLALAGIGIIIAMMSYRPYTPEGYGYEAPYRPAAHPAHPPAAHAPAAHPSAKRFRPFYQNHRVSVLRVSDYSKRARTNRVVALICFALFAFVTLPGNARGARAFYHQLVATKPLPAAAGEDDENNRRARQLLFFYLLFLIYQVVQFPLTWGRDNAVQFYSDLGFQTVLLIGVVTTFIRLKQGVAEQWQGDPERRERMQAWLSEKLEGLSVRWRDMAWLAVGMFVGAFTPPLLANLPDWLDVVAAY